MMLVVICTFIPESMITLDMWVVFQFQRDHMTMGADLLVRSVIAVAITNPITELFTQIFFPLLQN